MPVDIQAGGEKLKSGLLDWGIPAVSLISGIIMGDILQVGKFLNDTIGGTVKLGEKAMGVFTAAGYAVGGAFVWPHFGLIGHAIACFLWGMAIGTIYLALTGHALQIPGFSNGGA